MVVVCLPSNSSQESLVDEFSRGDKDTTACHEHDGCHIPDIGEYRILHIHDWAMNRVSMLPPSSSYIIIIICIHPCTPELTSVV